MEPTRQQLAIDLGGQESQICIRKPDGNIIAERRGKLMANVAMSRKLVGTMYALWRDGSSYDATKVSHLASGTWEHEHTA